MAIWRPSPPSPVLREEGRLRHGLRVAVRSPEAPPELLAQADLHVDGPDGALAFLGKLADLLETGRAAP